MGLLSRHIERLVVDEALHERLRTVGFAVAGPLLDAGEVEALRRIHATLEERIGVPQGPWFTTGMVTDRVTRRWLFDAVGEVLLPRLAPLFAGEARILSGNLHVNPVHPRGGLGPHQDIAMVDEAVTSTLNGWVSTSDSTTDNGALRFVPGSHRFGNRDRSLAAPWAYDGLHEVFWEHSVVVEVPAGHLVLFDTATIHCSTPNTSSTSRVAANCLIRRAERPLQHLVGAGTDEADVYCVEEHFLVEGDVTSAPAADEGRWIARRPLVRPRADEEHVVALCEQGMQLLAA